MELNALSTVMAVSILLQFGSAAMALSLIVKSGFFIPWISISAAVLLMGVRRLISFIGMTRTATWPPQQLVPELIALTISILMFAGLWFLAPMFAHIRDRHAAELQRKDVLIRESHHHVRNNLQLLQSMFNLREGALADDLQRNFLREMVTRVQSFALLHEQLYHHTGTLMSCRSYLQALVDGITTAYADLPVRVAVEIEDFSIERSELLNIGIVVNEAALNSFKHAFAGIENPVLGVKAWRDDEHIHVTMHDNGVGMPAEIIEGRRSGFGTEMIRTLCSNPGWQLQVENNGGTTWAVQIASRRPGITMV